MSTTPKSPEKAIEDFTAIISLLAPLLSVDERELERTLLEGSFHILTTRQAVLPSAALSIKRADGTIKETRYFYLLDHTKL